MNRHLLLSAVLVPLFGTGCDQPKDKVADRLKELEQRVASAEQEAAEARANQQVTERLLEEQRLASQRDALDRERILIDQDRANIQRLQEEQKAAAEAELRQREDALARREQSTIDLQNALSEKQLTLDQREAELSERDRELAGREALPDNSSAPPAPRPEPVDVNVFYDSLGSYGSWFDSPDYGYVWRPTVYRTAGWRPYTLGRWACTDRGWLWISDEPFGWATYHYGRWALCRTNGWIWVPGTEWAPSWVCWRTSGSHIGWAPLPPETLAYQGHRWDSSVEVAFGIGSAWFSFVEIGHFSQPIRNHCLPHTRNDYYWGNTVNITNIHVHNNHVISGGPSYGDIERQTKRRPPFYRIEEDRTGRHGANHGFNRIEKDRVVITPPRREESRTPDAVPNRPARVSGRLDNVEVVRSGKLDQDIVREFQKNREQLRKPGSPPGETTQIRQEETMPRHRGEEQRRLNERAQDLEKDARTNVDDRIRVLPRPAGESLAGPPQPKPPSVSNQRGEEQRRLNERAQDLEKDARKNVDDRIRVLPRPADNSPQPPRVPNPPVVEKPTAPSVSPRQPEVRRPQTPAPPPVLPRRDEPRDQDNMRQQQARQQQQAEEQQRQLQQQRQAEESRRQQQAAEESRRQQQRQAEESARRQAEAQRENQRRQEQAAEESRRQQRQAEESRRQQQQAEENARRQEQQRQAEEQQRRNQEESNRRNRR